MAIATTGSQVDYTGTNTTNQVCPFPYLFFDNTDLVVTTLSTSNVLTKLVLNTDYSVTGAGVSSGGNVTIFSAIPTSTKITIVRDVPETQLVSLTTGDRFPASIMERAFDKLTMLVQELSRGLNKALRFSDAVTNQPTLTPLPASVLGTDATNQLGFTSTTGATGTPPYFLAATAAGQPATFQTLPLITTNRIDDFAITEPKIANGAVTAAKIGGNPTAGQYVLGTTAGVVTWQLPSTASIADYSITGTKIANGAITTFHLANDSVNANRIIDGSVTTPKIADGQVTEAKIVANAVTTAKIADGAITNAKIATGFDAAKITTGTLPIDRIADFSILGTKLGTNTIAKRSMFQFAPVNYLQMSSNSCLETNLNFADTTFVATPTSSTGLQILAGSMTNDVNNLVLARFSAFLTSNLAGLQAGIAIFIGTTLLASRRVTIPIANAATQVDFELHTQISATASYVYSVRIWKYNDTTATNFVRVNGIATANKERGGSSYMTLILQEMKG